MRTTVLVTAGVLISSMLLRAQQPRATREHGSRWVAPPEQAAKANPLSARPDAAAGGKKLFQQRCSTCHGEDAAGTADAPDLTRSAMQRQSDGTLFWKISSGNTRTGMPSFSFLPPLQRWQLVLYIRSRANAAGASSAFDHEP